MSASVNAARGRGRASGRTRRAFIKSMFLGRIEGELVLPYPELSAEEAALVETILDSFTRFASEHIDAARFDREAHYPREVLKGLGELGMFGLLVPEEHGGIGLSQAAYCRVSEVVAGHDTATAAALGAHQSIGIKALLMFGTEEQKRRFLPSLASGEAIAAFALTEPSAGSDANNLRASATPTEDGSHFVLDGEKIWITNGGFADVFTVFARTGVETVSGKERNTLTAFLVTRDMKGVSTGAEEDKLGLRASSTTTVRLDSVRVPKENVLGELGAGFKVAVEVLNEGRLALAAGCIGGAKAILKEALAYAQSREAFGKTIAEFEMIQGKFAWMAIDIYVMESMVYLTAAMADRGEEDFSLESAACKIYCSERLWRIVNEALQVNGGNGFMRHLPYERSLRDARINLIFEGTNEILRIFTALGGVQRSSKYLQEIAEALKAPLNSFGVLTDYAARRLKRTVRRSPTLAGVHEELEPLASHLGRAVTELAETTEGALYHHRKAIIDRQLILSRIADMTIDIYAMAATIARTDALVKRASPEKAEHELHMCRRFVEKTWRRVRRNARRADFEVDAPLVDIARGVYERSGYVNKS